MTNLCSSQSIVKNSDDPSPIGIREACNSTCHNHRTLIGSVHSFERNIENLADNRCLEIPFTFFKQDKILNSMFNDR